MVHHTPSPKSDKPPAPAPTAHDMATDAAGLTAREQQVLPLLEADRTNKQIAQALGISLSTVRTHIRSIRQKLHAGHRDWARRRQAE